MKKRKCNNGLTLIELVVSISLIAIIIGAVSSVVYFSYHLFNENKRSNSISDNITNYISIIDNYMDAHSSLIVSEVKDLSSEDEFVLITSSTSSLLSKDNKLFIGNELAYTSSYTLTISISKYNSDLYKFSLSCENIEQEMIKSII